MRHLKYSLCLLALTTETLGYTVPMGVSPKVQPMFISSNYKHWVTLYPWVRHLKYSLCLLALTTETLGYTVTMGVSPKVQPMFISSNYKHWVTLYPWVGHQKYSLCLLTLHCTYKIAAPKFVLKKCSIKKCLMIYSCLS